jgi:hypothetical protein
MCFVELKPGLNNKDIFNVQYMKQCKMKFESLNTKGLLLNMQNVKDVGTRKIVAILNRDA